MRWRSGYRNDPRFFQRSFQSAFTGGQATRDEQVRWVQYALNSILNQNLPVDGVMSPTTRTAVRNFQQRSGLPVTGYVGPDTQQTLLAATTQQAPASDGQVSPGVGGPEPSGDGGAPPATDTLQATSDAELFEYFPQNESSDNEFESFSDHENWESELNSGNARGHCNCHQQDSGTPPSEEFEFEWEEEDQPKKRINFPAEQVTADMCKYAQTFTVDGYSRGAHELNPKQQEVLNDIKHAIRKRAENCGAISKVDVGGHTNTGGNPKIGGGPKYNHRLGLLRAEAIRYALRRVIPPKAIVSVHSQGGEKPVVYPDPTEREQLKNRRVEITVW